MLEEKERAKGDLLADEDEAAAPPPPPAPPAVPPAERKPGLDAAWEELLRRPPTVEIDGTEIEIPRLPDSSSEEQNKSHVV